MRKEKRTYCVELIMRIRIFIYAKPFSSTKFTSKHKKKGWRFKEAFEIWKFRFSLYSFKASFPKQNRLYLPRYFIKIPGRKHSTIINFSLLLIYCFYRQVFFYRNFYFSFSLGFPFCPQKKSFFSSGSYFYLLWEN